MKTIALLLFILILVVCAFNACSPDSNPPIQFDQFGGQIDDNNGRGAISQ